MSPTMKKPIGMGYVPTELAAVGSEILLEIRNQKVRARVVKYPFLNN
jgi:aminomethyltransferase